MVSVASSTRGRRSFFTLPTSFEGCSFGSTSQPNEIFAQTTRSTSRLRLLDVRPNQIYDDYGAAHLENSVGNDFKLGNAESVSTTKTEGVGHGQRWRSSRSRVLPQKLWSTHSARPCELRWPRQLVADDVATETPVAAATAAATARFRGKRLPTGAEQPAGARPSGWPKAHQSRSGRRHHTWGRLEMLGLFDPSRHMR
jgi:hypothetical protein